MKHKYFDKVSLPLQQIDRYKFAINLFNVCLLNMYLLHCEVKDITVCINICKYKYGISSQSIPNYK